LAYSAPGRTGKKGDGKGPLEEEKGCYLKVGKVRVGKSDQAVSRLNRGRTPVNPGGLAVIKESARWGGMITMITGVLEI